LLADGVQQAVAGKVVQQRERLRADCAARGFEAFRQRDVRDVLRAWLS